MVKLLPLQFLFTVAPVNVTLSTNLSRSDYVCAVIVVNFTCTVEAANPDVDAFTLYENGSSVQNTGIRGVWIRRLDTGGEVTYRCEANNTINVSSSDTATYAVKGKGALFSAIN